MSPSQTFSSMLATLRQDPVRNHMVFLPSDRVSYTADRDRIDATPIAADSAYCRLWLREMRISHRWGWFRTFYPVVQASIRFMYGGQTIPVPCLAGPGLLAELTQNNLDHVVGYDYPLTPLFPFRGGDIEVQAGLLSTVTGDPIKRFVAAIGRIAEIIPTPEFSTVLNLVQPVYDAIEDLMGVEQSTLQIGYQGRFVSAGGGGANQLRSGYFAAIRDEQGTIDLDELCVVDGHLKVGATGAQGEFNANPRELNQCSYMLFFLEKRSQQDWGGLTTIDRLGKDAQKATLFGTPDDVRTCWNRLVSAVLDSNDLLPTDQNSVIRYVKAALDRLPLQAMQPQGVRSLTAIMRQESVPALDEETEAELANVRELRRKLNEGA